MATITNPPPPLDRKLSSRLHMLFAKLRIDEETKRDMIYECTLGQTKSTKDLSSSQAERLVKELQAKITNDPANKQRRKMFSIAHELGWHLPGTMAVDRQRLEAWVLKYGYLHKPLMSYQLAELPTLVSQLESVLKSKYK